MAEAGSNSAMMADGVPLLGADVGKGLEKALRSIGAICPECERPTFYHRPAGPASMHEFKLCQLQLEEGRPKVVVSHGYCCSRSDCEGFDKWSRHPNVIAVRDVPAWEIIVPPKPEDDVEEQEDATCRLCGVAKGDPHEPCSSCGKLDRPPKEML